MARAPSKEGRGGSVGGEGGGGGGGYGSGSRSPYRATYGVGSRAQNKRAAETKGPVNKDALRPTQREWDAGEPARVAAGRAENKTRMEALDSQRPGREEQEALDRLRGVQSNTRMNKDTYPRVVERLQTMNREAEARYGTARQTRYTANRKAGRAPAKR